MSSFRVPRIMQGLLQGRYIGSNVRPITRFLGTNKLQYKYLRGKGTAGHPASNSVIHRQYSTNENTQATCYTLEHRSLVKVSGKDTPTFLQGLLTNDMRCIGQPEAHEKKCDSIYSMMLNVQGRVLYDMIVYNLKAEEEPCYLLECDKEVVSELIGILKRYKIRKKVKLEDVGDEYKTWAIIRDDIENLSKEDQLAKFPLQCLEMVGDNIAVASSLDPRLHSFGCRMVVRPDQKVSEVLKNVTESQDIKEYHRKRYIFGIGEGTVDHPPGNCTPLESNAVFLNGVSFSKGCYIGQELTARTHHTGVIRKRLMPITFIGDYSKVQSGDTVENSSKKNCGKYRNSIDQHGLALLRVADVVGKGQLAIKNKEGEVKGQCETYIPYWWPAEYHNPQTIAANT